MNRCEYCGRDNEDNATHCRECGTELASAQTASRQKAALETVDIQSDLSPDEEATPSVPIDADQQRPTSLPGEYWLLIGIAISASGYFYTVIAVVIMYLLLKRMRPLADWELLMAASGITGTSIFGVLHLLSLNASPLCFLEPAIVTGAAIGLLFTQWRNLARLLVAYQALGVLVDLFSALLPSFKAARPEAAVFMAVIDGLGIWLLMRWLRRHRSAGEGNPADPIVLFRKS